MQFVPLYQRAAGYVAFLALGLIWGSNFIFTKISAEMLNAQEIVWVRLFFGFLPLFLIAFFSRQLKLRHIKYIHHFLVMAVIATAFYYLAYARGTQLLPSGTAGALSGSVTLFSAVTAWCFGAWHRITLQRLMGVLLGLIGIVLLSKPWHDLTHGLNPLGILLMLVGSLSLGLSFNYAEKFVTVLPISNLALATYQVGLALLLMSLATPFDTIIDVHDELRVMLASVVGLGVIGTACAYFLYYFMLSRLSTVQSASVTYLPPVVAMSIGVFLAGEVMTLLDLGGLTCISLGMYFLQRR